jgi:hypothetical protein
VGDGVLDRRIALKCSGIGELDGEKLGSEISLLKSSSSIRLFSSLLIVAVNNRFANVQLAFY